MAEADTEMRMRSDRHEAHGEREGLAHQRQMRQVPTRAKTKKTSKSRFSMDAEPAKKNDEQDRMVLIFFNKNARPFERTQIVPSSPLYIYFPSMH